MHSGWPGPGARITSLSSFLPSRHFISGPAAPDEAHEVFVKFGRLHIDGMGGDDALLDVCLIQERVWGDALPCEKGRYKIYLATSSVR